MNILFYGFRHAHILDCYRMAQANPNVQILCAIEENTPARLSAQEKLGISIAPDGYNRWLENSEVDTVVIGGAYGNRGQAVIKALRAGKHVFADKPLCTSLAELEEIRTLAAEKQLKVGCMLDLRKVPAVETVKALLDSGKMGTIHNINFSGQHCVDYANRPGWYFEPGMHGGTINDIAIHGIDLITYLTGQRINYVSCAKVWNAFANRHPDFCDCAMFMAQTAGDAHILADVSYAAPSQVFSMPTYWNFQIWCARGLITFNYVDSHVTIYEDGASGPEYFPCTPAESNILDDFIAEIQQDTTTFTDSVLAASETALRIQQIADSTTNMGVSL